jgi:hypothetical protein
MKKELKELIEVFVDEIEEEFGNLEGIEIKLEHPINEGKTDNIAKIKEFTLYYLHKENIWEKLG